MLLLVFTLEEAMDVAGEMEDSGFVLGTNLSYFFAFIFISHLIDHQK